MTNDLFGGFGGLMKGLSSFMPQDDPDVKLIKAQSDLNDLRNQETELYAEIGKQSLLRNSGQFPELESRLKLVQSNLSEAQTSLEAAHRLRWRFAPSAEKKMLPEPNFVAFVEPSCNTEAFPVAATHKVRRLCDY